MKQYDVFISYSRRDYVDEQENILQDSPVKAILDCLDENNISYWFDKDGLYKGAEFVEVIADAIADSKMMVFVSSEHSNSSRYTAGEIFEAIENDLLIIPLKTDHSQYNKKFKLLLNPLDYIEYYKADALSDMVKAINKEKERIAQHVAEMERKREEDERRKREEMEKLKAAERRKREEEERLAKRNAVLEEVKAKIADVENHRFSQKNLKTKVFNLLRSIDIVEKECPVCGSACNIEEDFCPVCGWHFSSFSGIADLDFPVSDEEKMALSHYSAAWEKSKMVSVNTQTEMKRLKNDNDKLRKDTERLTKENEKLKSDVQLAQSGKASIFSNKLKWLKITGVGCAGTISLCIGWFFIMICTDMCGGESKNRDVRVNDTTEIIGIVDTTVIEETKNNKTFTVNGVDFTMVYVEGGTFMMGSENSDKKDEKPVHKVTLSDYYIGKTEVTQGLWKAVMGNNPSYFKGDDLPVERVSWNDCQKFIEKLNNLTGESFSLPTEAQWEFAARGGIYSKGYKYSGSDVIDEVAWYGDKSSEKTHPVGKKLPNDLEIYDMTGNVWEWCCDFWGNYTIAEETDPKGPSHSSGFYHVTRGGSWISPATSCRCAYRYYNSPESKVDNLGLRLALK